MTASPRQRLFILNDPHAMRISAELAAEIGLMESIVLLQFEFLLSISTIERRGRKWIRATLEELRTKHFRWSSRATIWRAIQSLESGGLIVIENFNPGSFDKTLSFALNMRGIERLKSVRVFQDETGDVFQIETSQVSGGTNREESPSLFQDETAVANRDVVISDRDVDSRDLKHRSDQNETSIGRDLQAGDLPSSPKDAGASEPSNVVSIPGRDTGKETSEILQVALRRGRQYPRRFRGHLAKEIKNLLDEGFGYHVVLEAAKRCETKTLNPGAMASLVNEVQNGGVSPQRNGHKPFDPTEHDYTNAVIR